MIWFILFIVIAVLFILWRYKMTVQFSNDKISDIYFEGRKIKEVYYGNQKVYGSSQPWIQPVIKSNGTMGGNSFACKANNELINYGVTYYAWGAFKGSKFNINGSTVDGQWQFSGSNIWLAWYNPAPLNIKKLVFDYVASSDDPFVLQYSHDNGSWTTIKSGKLSAGNLVHNTINVDTNTIFAKYWRIYITPENILLRALRNLTITALV